MKRIWLSAIIFCFILIAARTIYATVLGDINNDGKVDLQETIYSLQVVTGIKSQLITIDVASYANFHGKWEYQNTDLNYETPSVEVIGTGTKNGKEVYILQEYDPAGYPNDQGYYLTDMSYGLKIILKYGKNII